jgi:DNA-binding response OmpR family regulator
MVAAPSILIVDDDPAVLGGLVALLREHDFPVAGASSFADAKRLLSNGAYGLLVTDVRLGAFNGLHLVVHAQLARQDIAAIVVTAFDDPVIKTEARRLGAQYVLKPLDPVEFLALVATTLAGVAERP